MKPLLDYIISTCGSLTGVALWFHFDLDDYWRLLKIRRGRAHYERDVQRDATALAIHAEALAEFNDR